MGKGFKDGSTSIGKTETKWTGFMIFLGKYRTYLYVALALFIAAFSFTMVREVHKVFMLDLTSASDEALKRVLFSEDSKPYIFHCAKRDKTASKDSSSNSSKGVYVTSPLFEELFKLRKDEYNFAKLNCYQILPSGKNIFDRFGLDKKSLPVIFGNSPWLIKPLQAKGSALSTVHNLAVFLDKEVATPHATPISDNEKLHSHCKFINKKPLNNASATEKNNEESNKDDKTNTSCIVLMRGALFTEKHSEVEGQLIRKFPKQRFAVVDALKHRFTFERPFENPASSFGYKLIVLRNGTHWRTMGDKYFSIDDSSEFVSISLSSPISEFHMDNSNTSTSRIKLLKANSPFFKRAKKSKNSVREDSEEDDDDDEEDSGTKMKQKSTPKQRSKGTKKTASSTSSSSSSDNSKQPQEPPPPEPVVLTDEEVAKRVREREQAARARMGERDDIRFDVDDNDDGEEGGEEEEGGESFDGNNGEVDDDSAASKVNSDKNSHENDDEDVIEL